MAPKSRSTSSAPAVETCSRKGCTNPAWKYRTCKHHYVKCKTEGCDRPQIAHSYCMMHYRRLLRGADREEVESVPGRAAKVGPLRGTRFPVEIDDALSQTAEREGVAVYDLIQQIVKAWYETGRKPAAPAPVLR